MTLARNMNSIGDKERYLIGFALGVFCLSVIVQFAFGPWSSRKGKSLDQSTDCSDLESAHVYGEMQSRI